MSNKIDIALVDDHKIVREGIISLLKKANPELNIVFEANNGKDFIEKLQVSDLIPEIALVDLEMTVMNGYDTIKWLHENYPDIKVMVLSQVIDELRVKEILKLGIDGYFDKNGDINDLSKAINVINVGGGYFPSFVKDAQISLNNNNKSDYLKGLVSGVYFSEEEINLITLAYKGYLNKELSDILKTGIKNVEAYLGKIYRKMDLDNKQEMIRYAIQNKLIDVNK